MFLVTSITSTSENLLFKAQYIQYIKTPNNFYGKVTL